MSAIIEFKFAFHSQFQNPSKINYDILAIIMQTINMRLTRELLSLAVDLRHFPVGDESSLEGLSSFLSRVIRLRVTLHYISPG